MQRLSNHSLLHNNTFGIDNRCDEFLTFDTVADAVSIAAELAASDTREMPFLILGGGSNLLLTRDFHGRVVTPAKRFEVEERVLPGDEGAVYLRCWAGTTFDDVVDYAVVHGCHGLENLSLIPGECGASAVQNIGAYGVEAKDVIHDIEAVEIATGKVVTIMAEACGYGYRQSRFKQEWRDRFLITHVTYRLARTFVPRLDYGNIRRVLDDRHIAEAQLTACMLREVIIDIRRAKLPEPEVLGNAGSFFMNPMVDAPTLDALKSRFPDLRYFEVSEGSDSALPGTGASGASAPRYKIPAGWMIDRCGWKGRQMGRAGVYEKQALVLVNHGGATGSEVVALMQAIQADVYAQFGIQIHPEVNIV